MGSNPKAFKHCIHINSLKFKKAYIQYGLIKMKN